MKTVEQRVARTSTAFVAGQFGLIGLFAGAVLMDFHQALRLPAAFAWIGLAICLAGVVIGAAALVAMGRVMQVSPQPKEGAHLVTRGVYRYLRHPMYTAILLVAVGLFLRKPTLLVGIAGAALIALLLAKARFEETLLQARYAGYGEYRRRTWGVIPPLR